MADSGGGQGGPSGSTSGQASSGGQQPQQPGPATAQFGVRGTPTQIKQVISSGEEAQRRRIANKEKEDKK
ncbi:MAG: hypothetical protein M4579_006515 [Chaenotheca gracillima]|nr:MAG: hypothetical protein M4579_006515 [Chaenotheca gracillima]